MGDEADARVTSQSVRLVGGGRGGQRRSTFSITTPGQWDEVDARVTSQSVRLVGWGGDGGGGDQRPSTFSVTTPGQWDEVDARVTSQSVRLIGWGEGGANQKNSPYKMRSTTPQYHRSVVERCHFLTLPSVIKKCVALPMKSFEYACDLRLCICAPPTTSGDISALC